MELVRGGASLTVAGVTCEIPLSRRRLTGSRTGVYQHTFPTACCGDVMLLHAVEVDLWCRIDGGCTVTRAVGLLAPRSARVRVNLGDAHVIASMHLSATRLL